MGHLSRSKNSSNHTLYRFKRNINFFTESKWVPDHEHQDEFNHLRCDLMTNGNCSIGTIQQGWEIRSPKYNENYGFILDHRWHCKFYILKYDL
jgi:hypothetical protein